MQVCDFCMEEGVRWTYPCRDFPITSDGVVTSTGEWGACETCHKLLQKREKVELAMRVADALHKYVKNEKTHKEWEDALSVSRSILQKFYKNRIAHAVEPFIEEPQFAA